MKTKRWGMHAFYLLVILTLLIGIGWLGRGQSRANEILRREEAQRQADLKLGLSRLCDELSGDLFSAAEADSQRLYLSKLTEIRSAAGQALVLLSANGRQTPWISFWQSLENYSAREADSALERGTPPEDRSNLTMLAEVAQWLSAHPETILDETTESLPDELKLPTLQTTYAVDEKKTLQVARRALNVRGGLTELSGGPPGVRSYGCANARVDVLQSGELLYLSLRLPTGEGLIDRDRAAEVFADFAEQEGFGKVQIIDLYAEGDEYHGRLAPLVKTPQLGRIPDLDRTIDIACTAWSGTVCYFSAGRFFSPSEYAGTQGMIDDEKIEAMALDIGARIGEAFLYRGRICRPLISERIGFAGRAVLCVDAVTGAEVDLFYVSHERYGERVLY
ncbi:MAG: hypothetical protein IJX76_07220 [Clostridia bacterium]|nr:hypothetical protein [Clostridia bacterium]